MRLRGIEADGGQHYENKERQRDEFRARELSILGVKIRFSDREILRNIEGVCEVIQRAIEDKRVNPPHLNPLPRGERKEEGTKLPSTPLKTLKPLTHKSIKSKGYEFRETHKI